jgi:hypothetical protein
MAAASLAAWRKDQGPRIAVPEIVEIGEVSPWKPYTRPVEVQNTGDAPLSITGIYPDCSCSKAYADRTTLGSGERTLLHMEFTPTGGIGAAVNLGVMVKTDDPVRPTIVVRWIGRMKLGAIGVPAYLRLGELRRGETKEGDVLVVTPGFPGSLDVEEMSSLVSGLELKLDPASPASQYPGANGNARRIHYRYTAGDTLGQIEDTIRLRLRSEVAKELEIPFSVTQVPVVNVIPKALVLPMPQHDIPPTSVNATVDAPSPIQSIALLPQSGLSSRWLPSKDGKSRQLTLEFSNELLKSQKSGIAEFEVSCDGRKEQLHIPWRTFVVESRMKD